MKQIYKVSYYLICFLFFYLICFGSNLLYADKGENETWSFDFKDCTISDALSQITRNTGIKVFANKTIDKKISNKSYNDKAIDQVLMDILGNENYAMVWYYDGEDLDSIGIWTFDQAGDMEDFSPNKLLGEKGINPKDKTMRVKRHFQRQESSETYLSDYKESVVSQYSKTSTKDKSYYGGYKMSNKQRKSENQMYDSGKSINSQSVYTDTTGQNKTSSDNQDQEASEGGINNDLTQQPTVVDLPAVPGKWQYLEPPPMPPGF